MDDVKEAMDLDLDEELSKYTTPQDQLSEPIQEDKDSQDQHDEKEQDGKEEVKLVSDEPFDRFEALPRPVAIFLHGVNDMSTEQVVAYCNHPQGLKVEWIDDSACNLVMTTASEAKELAESLLVDKDEINQLNHKTLLKTKPFRDEHDEVLDTLSLRIATDEDVKRRGASERSRYYRIYGTDRTKLRKETIQSRKEMIDRMSKNGGDGRSVFDRLDQEEEEVTEEEKNEEIVDQPLLLDLNCLANYYQD
ncbi:hypothetical protein G6F37_002260 [Rhizopus arrhizus]|nr:hypothetical protein G6F37_002260 [Rhizopus arrhizus]